MSTFVRQVGALIGKDLIREWRTKEITTTTVAFSVLLMLVFSFAFFANDELVTAVFPGILWVGIAFTGTLAIGRTFTQERDSGCLRALALVPGTWASLYVSKLTVNLLFMFAFEAVLLPFLALAFNLSLSEFGPMLVLAVVVGTVGFAAVGTLVAAMLVHNQMRDVMIPLLLYPLTIPIIIGGVEATQLILLGGDATSWLRVLAGVDIIFLGLSAGLFRWVLSAIE